MNLPSNSKLVGLLIVGIVLALTATTLYLHTDTISQEEPYTFEHNTNYSIETTINGLELRNTQFSQSQHPEHSDEQIISGAVFYDGTLRTVTYDTRFEDPKELIIQGEVIETYPNQTQMFPTHIRGDVESQLELSGDENQPTELQVDVPAESFNWLEDIYTHQTTEDLTFTDATAKVTIDWDETTRTVTITSIIIELHTTQDTYEMTLTPI